MNSDVCSGATLQPAAYCTFDLVFTPAAKGDFSAALTLASNDPDENPKALALTGSGSIVPVADLQLTLNGILQQGTELAYAFGATRSAADVAVTIENQGTGPLSLVSIALAAPPGPFALTADSCSGAPLAPGESCGFTLSFAPPGAGDFGDSLTFSTNDPDEPAITLVLSGQGLAAGVNAPPSALSLIYPAHGQRQVEHVPDFRFRPCTDPDGDEVSYAFFLSTRPDFADIAPQAVSDTRVYLSGLGAAALLLLIPGYRTGQSLRRKMLLLAALLLLGAATLLLPACGGGGSGSGVPPAAGGSTPATMEYLSFTHPTPLASNTTYYWKVVAKDGQGGGHRERNPDLHHRAIGEKSQGPEVLFRPLAFL